MNFMLIKSQFGLTLKTWVASDDDKKITDAELMLKRERLDQLLGFPKKIKRSVMVPETVMDNIAQKANKDVAFRKKIAALIKDYSKKLEEVEMTGIPMIISKEDFSATYQFGTDNENSFISSSVIEVLRNEGAQIYELD